MPRIYTFISNSISAGHTVMVYRTRTVGKDARVKHVKSMDRVTVVGGVVYVDGVSTVGKTICIKP